MNQHNPIEKHAVQDSFELSIGQKELWFIHAMGGLAESAYNEPLIFQLKGELNIDKLKKAVKGLIAKHGMLRTAFSQDSQGQVLQKVYETIPLAFVEETTPNEAALEAYTESFIRQPFDLGKPGLMRFALISCGPKEYRFIIVLHHIITDGTSFGILIQDLNNFYQENLLDSEQAPGAYRALLETTAKNSADPSYQTNASNLAAKLEDYTQLNFLATPSTNAKADLFSGNRVYFELENESLKALKALAKAEKVTVFHVLYACYLCLIKHYTRSDDIVIGVPFANREADPEKAIVGYFINTLPIRQPLDDRLSFVELLKQVKSAVFHSLCHQNVAFEHMASHLKLERKALGQHPLIQTLFVWGSRDKLQLEFEAVEASIVDHCHTKTSKFDISLFMLEDNQSSVKGYFEYRDALFEHDMMEAFKNSFQILLDNLLANPQQKLSSISLLNSETLDAMKAKFFKTKYERLITQSLVDLFAETVRRFPSNRALIFEGKHYDYATVDRMSNQWANTIRHHYQKIYGKALTADCLVALCVDRNEDMIFAMLGILKAGAAYVPVDPQYPAERRNYILQHSQSALLLTHYTHQALDLAFDKDKTLYLDDETHKQSPYFIDTPVAHQVAPKDAAYVLYTSGSTGQPKGVVVTHENVNSLFHSLDALFTLNEKDVWSLFHTFCFDISVWEIWGAFLYGGALLVIPFETSRDPAQFYQLVADEKVSVLTQTASAFQMFINEDLKHQNKLNALRYVGFVGESLKVSILRPWVEKYGTASPQLANLYGITETTVYTNCKFVLEKDIERGRDNIGWPLEEFGIAVLDEKNQWCPVGIVGEICISGRGLSRGYLYRDDLTKERFIPDPYADFLGLKPDSLLYRTGDLGRWLADGSIEYLGRKDFQIKLRGFRIELGEIEASIGSFKGVSHTQALLKGEGEASYIAAYYTTKPGIIVDKSDLIRHLKSFLPDYMVPTVLTELAAFPMTVNGKVDRAKLMSHQDQAEISSDREPLSTPRQRAIAEIWSDLLHVPQVALGANSNFFDLGGNSLLIVKMLSQINQAFDIKIPLGQLIASPSIAHLAKLSEGEAHKDSYQQLCQQLTKDIRLDPTIQALPTANPHCFSAKKVLLTGASGFLGAYLLDALLNDPTIMVYCLVRAESKAAAFNKILAKLRQFKRYDEEKIKRISVVIGDLEKPALGLSDADCQLLAEDVDAIMHVAAWVHHIYDYQTLRQSNVESVRALLKLAVSRKNKALHFISTLAAGSISPLERLDQMDGYSEEAKLCSNGYVLSKWAAEQLLKTAHERGIAAYVYRPGNIIASIEHPVYEPENNHTLLRLKGMLQLGKGYVHPAETLEMMPVDCLAKAIINLSAKPERFSYNLHHQQDIRWTEYLKLAAEFGYDFSLIDQKDWQTIITAIDETNAFYKLSQFYTETDKTEAKTVPAAMPSPDFLIETPDYPQMIRMQIRELMASGFLSAPKEAHIALLE